jgi:phenylacetate-coenzyme A ligase PaaK-like adenylate-forming protein
MAESIFNIRDSSDFEQECKRIFDYQYNNLELYHDYVDMLGINEIPFLPISFFKSHSIISAGLNPQITFLSSGTTGDSQSRHMVADLSIYKTSFLKSFAQFYGSAKDYCFLALLPSYLEREGSSLIYMVQELITQSKYPTSGFYLDELLALSDILRQNHIQKIPTILFGVSYALLDLAEKYPQSLPNLIIMETGGMKGNRPEIPKKELHKIIQLAFNVNHVHSEYGMTELLSQAYSNGFGKFTSPPWMKVVIRDIYDPFRQLPPGKTGGINIIDLANIYSCSFIQTDDLGRINEDGTFEVLGRLNASDLRGCNLLIQ